MPNPLGELYNEERLNDPVKSVEEKWKLVPAFLRLRGLVKQHIDSFNYFINVDMKNIVTEHGVIRPNNLDYRHYYIKFTGVSVGKPGYVDDNVTYRSIYPNECRIRDMTYAAPIYCDVEYTVGNKIERRTGVLIGRMPIMLGSSNCRLSGMSHEELARKKECPYDPRGYFIIKGSEKAVLIQEQISKNRVIIEEDPQKNLCAQVTSTSLTQKTRTTIVYKNKKFYLK